MSLSREEEELVWPRSRNSLQAPADELQYPSTLQTEQYSYATYPLTYHLVRPLILSATALPLVISGVWPSPQQFAGSKSSS